MKRLLLVIGLTTGLNSLVAAQEIIPIDTVALDINAKDYIIEPFKGKDAIYLKQGSISLKDIKLRNGTIEYDIFLKEAPAFPGVYFRVNDNNAEQFYIRPHLSGKPDANQALPVVNGIAAWQLYFGPRYSFPYEYNYSDWTHVKLVVNENRAQVYLDHSKTPHLSWYLFHEPREGGIALNGGNAEAMHLANISVNTEEAVIKDFQPIERKALENMIPEWELSDKFEEKLLENPENLNKIIADRSWKGKVTLEEGTAANISKLITLRDENPGNTVFARVNIQSNREQLRLLEFGYSDRVVVILNGKPIYRGNNRWRSRDYRYLGTIGLFDAVYLPLKKGDNSLLMAVSEDFGGWLITGRISDSKGLKVLAK
ncbi:hypothetical protein [Poritiphilus flavus]|uniref:Uncharacterized protein n=1 Tax=Poritiphilus flavus TaxID=2697053 RepID=A0A6L9EG93_9FLAO|nr:hypothetical protein [Poritiphilus flavus]NAS13269.1 hypothetical protein [Poritiphilus flavus]